MGNLIKDNKFLFWSSSIGLSRTISFGSTIRFININFIIRPIISFDMGLITSINIGLISV